MIRLEGSNLRRVKGRPGCKDLRVSLNYYRTKSKSDIPPMPEQKHNFPKKPI